MAKTLLVFSAILFLFVLAISEIEAGGSPKLCEKPSKTFSGKCDNKQCDKKCKDWEKATHGACHKREAKDGCYCYFDCSKDKKTPPSKGDSPPPPPADGGSPPPPSDGGSPPPPSDGGSPPPDGGSPPPPSAH